MLSARTGRLPIDPKHEGALINLASLLMVDIKDKGGAERMCHGAIAAGLKHVSTVHLQLGLALLGRNDMGAAKAFREATRLKPDNALAHECLAHVQHARAPPTAARGDE